MDMIWNSILLVLDSVWHLTMGMAPYLLLGFFVGGVLYAFLPPSWIARYMGGESFGSVIRASLVGVPLPLCSCGVLPVAASARQSGAGKGPTLAFLISTPVTGIDAIIATAGVLGIVFTIARIIVSFILGLIAGALSIFLPEKNSLVPQGQGFCSSCELNPSGEKFLKRVSRAIEYAFLELPGSLFNSMLLGLVVAGLISALIPETMIPNYLGPGIRGIIVAVVIGIPLYVCATGSIPIAAAMILKGFSPGAALAFLIAGPATNAIAITTVKKILGTRALIIYLTTIFVGAIGFALLFDRLPFAPQVKMTLDPHRLTHHSLFYNLSAYALVLIMGLARIKQWLHSRKFKEAEKMAEQKNIILMKVPDMTCGHCEQTIRNGLGKLDSVKSVSIELKTKKVAVEADPGTEPQKILDTIKALGYSPELIQKS